VVAHPEDPLSIARLGIDPPSLVSNLSHPSANRPSLTSGGRIILPSSPPCASVLYRGLDATAVLYRNLPIQLPPRHPPTKRLIFLPLIFNPLATPLEAPSSSFLWAFWAKWCVDLLEPGSVFLSQSSYASLLVGLKLCTRTLKLVHT
jgi:hypothetical protein